MVFPSGDSLGGHWHSRRENAIDNQGLAEKLLTVVITRPASPILLAMAIFYLWAYMTRTERSRSATGRESTSFSVVAPNAS